MDAPSLIRVALQHSGWTRAELARRAGITQSVLSAYEHQSREPSVAALRRVLEAAGLQLVAQGTDDADDADGVDGVAALVAAARTPGAPAMEEELATVVLDGRDLAAQINADTRRRAQALVAAGCLPTLAIIVGREDEAAARYLRSLARAAERVDVRCLVIEATPGRLAATVAVNDERRDVHAMMVQTPLPDGLRLGEVAARMDPAKDVDGAHPVSVGRLALGLPAFAPATAEAVVEMLAHHRVEVAGRTVALIGRSTVVGRPLAQLLMNGDATVTVCHSRTSDLAAVTAAADIVVAAVGQPHLLAARHIRPGAVVVDVGTTVGTDGVLRGDVDPAVGQGRAGALTPVPGGVGPVTTAVLLRHVAAAAEAATGATPDH